MREPRRAARVTDPRRAAREQERRKHALFVHVVENGQKERRITLISFVVKRKDVLLFS